MVKFKCPHCHSTFDYDSKDLENQIFSLNMRAKAITARLSELKYAVYTTETQRERRRLLTEKHRIEDKLAVLSIKRKAINKRQKKQEYDIFKRVVRDTVGDVVFFDMIDKATKEWEQYQSDAVHSASAEVKKETDLYFRERAKYNNDDQTIYREEDVL